MSPENKARLRTVIGLAARVWPQKNIMAHEAAAKSAAPGP